MSPDKSKSSGHLAKTKPSHNGSAAQIGRTVEKNTAASLNITSLVAKGAKVNGDLVFTSGVKIDGEVHGNIEIVDNGTVYVSEAAFIEGNVNAPRIIVAGRINGSVRGADVRLYDTARVDGDIEYTMLNVADGANINGRISCKGDLVEGWHEKSDANKIINRAD